MAETLKRYEIINCKHLNVREKAALNSKIICTLDAGDTVQVVVGCATKESSSGITWLKIKSNSSRYWISAAYAKPVGYLDRTANGAKTVYELVVALGCKHSNAANSLATIKSKRVVNCATAASVALQLAGCLPVGKKVNHRSAIGSSAAVKKKNSLTKASTGTEHLIAGTCTIAKIGKKYSKIDSKYKRAGVVYIQDSNICVCAGGGAIWSCNESSSQMSGGRYIATKRTSGYPFSSPILYAIVPND